MKQPATGTAESGLLGTCWQNGKTLRLAEIRPRLVPGVAVFEVEPRVIEAEGQPDSPWEAFRLAGIHTRKGVNLTGWLRIVYVISTSWRPRSCPEEFKPSRSEKFFSVRKVRVALMAPGA